MSKPADAEFQFLAMNAENARALRDVHREHAERRRRRVDDDGEQREATGEYCEKCVERSTALTLTIIAVSDDSPTIVQPICSPFRSTIRAKNARRSSPPTLSFVATATASEAKDASARSSATSIFAFVRLSSYLTVSAVGKYGE